MAKEAAVSIATVSHVINRTRYVSPELTERVKKVIERLDYCRNGVARSLKTQRTYTIGLVVSDISNPFFSTLVRGVEDALAEEGYSLIICNTDETLEKEKRYIDILLQKGIDGVIFAPTGKGNENIQRLIRKKCPFVFIDRVIRDIEGDAVLSDNVEGAYRATKHLLERSHRRIGIILGLENVSTTWERLEGYEQALKEFGLTENSEFIIHGGSKTQGGYEACRQLFGLSDPPTAIFSTNSLMTLGVLKALKKQGLYCPQDISVIGFDDFEGTALYDPPLTTVAQEPYELGSKVARLLLQRLEGEYHPNIFQQVRLPTKLIIRHSVAEPCGKGGEKSIKRRKRTKTV